MGFRPRRSFEPGHKRKFLVLVDDTPECRLAVRYAARRVQRLEAAAILLLAVHREDDFPNWLGVGEVMEAEARAAAQALLDRYAAAALALTGVEPELCIKTGSKAGQILLLIEADEDISLLVLAAGTGAEGPGALVSTLASRDAATFPVPIVVVPGSLSDAEIDALA
jgi:nucleotide-binding universal stress UspA family protein